MKLITDKELLSSNIQIPERLVLTDNGAADIKVKGIHGRYTWIGYKHYGLSSEKNMKSSVRKFAEKIGDWLKSVYGSEPHIEDFYKTMDMFRVWVETNPNQDMEVE